jgi:hypothetical protein
MNVFMYIVLSNLFPLYIQKLLSRVNLTCQESMNIGVDLILFYNPIPKFYAHLFNAYTYYVNNSNIMPFNK